MTVEKRIFWTEEDFFMSVMRPDEKRPRPIIPVVLSMVRRLLSKPKLAWDWGLAIFLTK